MKIGLISINMHTKSLNFACPIHSWAFQRFLKLHGIETKIIDYTPNYNDNFPAREPAAYYEMKYKELLEREPQTEAGIKDREIKLRQYKAKWDGYAALHDERCERFDKFHKFVQTHYDKTEEPYDEVKLEKVDSGFDCYICVTDVIWSCDEYWGFDSGFLLDCKSMENKWKISYAASRGVPKSIPKYEEEYFARAVSDIDFISVREKSLEAYVHSLLPEKQVTTVIDPVLLLPVEEYENILIRPKIENYIVVYYAMERPKELFDMAIRYAKTHNVRIVELTHLPIEGGMVQDKDVEVIQDFAAGPEEWLGYLKYADCIFTNSFHATCFSILFHKKFFNSKRNGDKLSNLLETFELTDRTFDELRKGFADRAAQKGLRRYYHSARIFLGMEKRPFDREINYRNVERLLTQERQKSGEFILSAIAYAEQHPRPHTDYDAVRKNMKMDFAYYGNSTEAVWTGGEINTTSEELRTISNGKIEYRQHNFQNSGEIMSRFDLFRRDGYSLEGWYIRIRVKHNWYWVNTDGGIVPRDQDHKPSMDREHMLVKPGMKIPYVPIPMISVMIADAVWKKIEKEENK